MQHKKRILKNHQKFVLIPVIIATCRLNVKIVVVFAQGIIKVENWEGKFYSGAVFFLMLDARF